MNFGSILGKRESAMSRTVSDAKVGGNKINTAEAATVAGVGAAIGAVAGGVMGYTGARSEIAQVPVESVTLSWREPVTQNSTLGHIPQDQYFPANHWGDACSDFNQMFSRPTVSPNLRGSEPIVRPVPVLDGSGNPVCREVTQTFSDHGKPTVHTHSHTVKLPALDSNQPFRQTITEDNRYVTCDNGLDSEGRAQTRTVTVLDGVQVRFRPNVVESPVASPDANYQTKSVSFDHGVAVGSQVLRGVFIGAGVGAVLGLVGDIAKQTLANRA